MTELEFYENGKKASFPSSWSEMSPEQVAFVFKTYDDCVRRGRSPLEFNIRVLYYFLHIRHSWRDTVKAYLFPEKYERISENIYRLCDEYLAFLFTKPEDGGAAVLSFDSVANPLPKVKVRGGRWLVGPSDLLQDVTFSEFRHAASAIDDFFQMQEVSSLDECIAILYRPSSRTPNRAGRYVRPLKNRTMDRDIRLVSGLPAWQKNLIMMWFSNCLKYLQEGVISIDGEAIDMSRMFAGDKDSGSDTSFTWNDLLVQIARDQSVGNIERVDEEPLFSIFSIMWSNHKENKRNEKIIQSAKGK